MADHELESLGLAKEHVRRVIATLRISGGSYVTDLENLLAGMNGWYATKESLFKIGELCDPKALGDQFVAGYSAEEWIVELNSLKRDCAHAFNELEGSE